MAQQIGAMAALPENTAIWWLTTICTPLSEALTLSPVFCGYQAYKWYIIHMTDTYTPKILQKKNPRKKINAKVWIMNCPPKIPMPKAWFPSHDTLWGGSSGRQLGKGALLSFSGLWDEALFGCALHFVTMPKGKGANNRLELWKQEPQMSLS